MPPWCGRPGCSGTRGTGSWPRSTIPLPKEILQGLIEKVGLQEIREPNSLLRVQCFDRRDFVQYSFGFSRVRFPRPGRPPSFRPGGWPARLRH